MEDLRFIELTNIEREYSNPIDSFGSIFTKPNNTISFIGTVKSFDTQAKDVTKQLNKGCYGLQNKFTMLYLYDFLKDTKSINFLTMYGGNLHNKSSSNVSILTYYSSTMVKAWRNVQFRDQLDPVITKEDNVNAYRLMNTFKEVYGVQSLPALVVIKKDKDEKEEFFNIDLTEYNEQKLYEIFKNAIDIINDNCEEDFKILSSKLSGSIVKKGSSIETINTASYVQNLVKKEDKEYEYKYQHSYTLCDLATELNFDVKTLRNKRKYNSFTRNECIFIGLRFGIDLAELNELLRVNDHSPLIMEGRDEVCVKALINKEDPQDVHDKLIKLGYKGILNPERDF